MGNFTYLVEGLEEVTLHGQLDKDIAQLVNEELGVQYGVTRASFQLMEKIEDIIKTIPKQYFPNIDGASLRVGKFKFKMLKKEINVDFRYINFRDKFFYNKGIIKINKRKDGFKLDTLTLTMDVYAIGGQIVETTFSDTVQHELEHYFQETKRGKPFNDDRMYKVARFVKEHFGQNDETAYRIGNLLYFSRKCEAEAYTNGLYSLLVQNYKKCGNSTDSVLYQSPIYQGLLQFRRDKKWLLSNRNNPQVNALLNIIRAKEPKGMGLNITIDKILKFVNKADDEIVRRIGRVITKAQKDCNVENDLKPSDWKYINYDKIFKDGQ